MSQMKIGYLTPWQLPHAVAAYSEALIRDVYRSADVRVVGFELDNTGLADVDADVALEYLDGCDILHIQYQKDFYTPELLDRILSGFRKSENSVVLTMHGTSLWRGFPIDMIDHWAYHRLEDKTYVSDNISVIPMGVRTYDSDVSAAPRSVCCLGTRSHPDLVAEALDSSGGGILSVLDGSEWLPESELA